MLPAETITEPSATIIDDMSLVQKMQGNDQTFSQIADSALTHMPQEGVRSHIIDVVFDRGTWGQVDEWDKLTNPT